MQLGNSGTPTKVPDRSHLSSRLATTVDTAEKEIRTELRSHVYILRKSDEKHFFDTFLGGNASKSGRPVTTIAKEVESKLRASGDLGKKGWKSLPAKPSSENALYEPMVEILTAITDACTAVAGDDITIPLQWLDEHAHVTKSANLVDSKPDIAGVREGTPRTDGKGKIIPMAVWWRMIQFILEIKKAGNASTAVVQLLRYVREALTEQPDRRFMLSMVLAGKFLQVRLTVGFLDLCVLIIPGLAR